MRGWRRDVEVREDIKVKPPNKENDADDDEEERSGSVICEECGRGDHRRRLLVCRICDSGCHMDCLAPSLETHPEGSWICAECVAVLQNPDGSVELEEEISDGELSDLFAEADEAMPPSSRLRPSPQSQPGAFGEQRRSQRIQSRARRDPGPQHRTSWHVPGYLL
ncbi:PHD and RING finger domain-containing protein 1-like [Antennarius striatus]|uniref:PHD and RING finger domain-containing protein 1-like n=1 Tax=Antennarius striatus TaxID=241820 RepID=UPI0035AED553